MQALLEAGTILCFCNIGRSQRKYSSCTRRKDCWLLHQDLHSGTVGGGLVEAKALEYAQVLLGETNPTEQTKFVEWNLNRDVGMSCGGSVKLFFELLNTNTWEIIIFGSGHVAQALSTFTHDSGLSTDLS